MSTLYEILGRPPVQRPQNPSPNNNMLNQLQSFMSTFSGNPEQIVRNLMSSGRMSQEQFNRLSQQATQIRQMMG